jgi:drug/metabolite transporter (DMT)-like permease
LFAWLVARSKVPALSLAGICLGLVGTAVLAKFDSEQRWTLGLGEGLTFVAAMVFAVQVLLLDRFGREVPSAHMTVGFFAICGILSTLLGTGWALSHGGLDRWLQWTVAMLRDPSIAVDMALMTVFCTVLAFHWMNVYQPRVSASRAALIYLLEPVFASLFSVVWGYDAVSPRLLLGGGIILGGNLLAEMPRLLYEWRKPRAPESTRGGPLAEVKQTV